MFRRLRREDPNAKCVRRLYEGLVARARAPVFFENLGIPDTIDGRFDLLTLHAFLVLDALKNEPKLGEALATTIFTGFDEALRDLGVGDMGLSRRIKAMANAFYGRLEAYEASDGSESALADAVLRNIYRGEPGHDAQARSIARYVLDARACLALLETRRALSSGVVDFGPMPKP